MAHKGQKTKVASDKSPIVQAIPRACADETAAVEFMEQMRWDGLPGCPRCGDTDVYQMQDAKTGQRNKRFLWRCRGCKRQFTVRIGTVFEESRIPLRHWCYAFWAACSSKKGVSALQIKRMTGLTYKSALFLMHRIRCAMAEEPGSPPRLLGTVEADETFVGGKPRYREAREQRRRPHQHGKPVRPWTTKTAVMAMVQRGGDVRATHIGRVTASNLRQQLSRHVDERSRLITDEERKYRPPGARFKGGHETVHHGIGEYVRGDVYTNTVEGFFALLKRGIYGTFHHVSKKHLQRYVDEFVFRYNARKMDDGARVALAIRGANGKRLMYREPLAV